MADPGPSPTVSSLEVDVVRHAEIWDRIAVSDEALARAARAAFAAAPADRQEPCEATIVLTDDAEMRALNRAWRGKDSSTNVLSFPAGYSPGAIVSEPRPLGDVVLAAETVLAESADRDIPAADHAAHLVVHGMLHLLGFDHERDEDAEAMEALETRGALHDRHRRSLCGGRASRPCRGIAMSNAPLSDDELPAASDQSPEEEPSWLERVLARFGLGEEPDLREVIEDALTRAKGAGDTFSGQERAMLLKTLRFGKLTVEDVMVPRADIIAVEESMTVAELMAVFREAEHSRLPVYRETLDDPRGMIHIRDLMSWITTAAEKSGAPSLDLGAVDLASTVGSIDITREILYVPPSMPVLDLLLRMQLSRRHLALVVDEYGGTDGLVSIEDLVEEVVGEIEDEHDVAEEAMIRQDPKLGLIADARTPIEDLARHLGVELATPEQEEDIDTIGGLVFSLAGRIPARGELVRHPSGIEFEVLEADPRRIKKLRIHKAQERKETPTETPAPESS